MLISHLQWFVAKRADPRLGRLARRCRRDFALGWVGRPLRETPRRRDVARPTTRAAETPAAPACWRTWDGIARYCTSWRCPTCAARAWDREWAPVRNSPSPPPT